MRPNTMHALYYINTQIQEYKYTRMCITAALVKWDHKLFISCNNFHKLNTGWWKWKYIGVGGGSQYDVSVQEMRQTQLTWKSIGFNSSLQGFERKVQTFWNLTHLCLSFIWRDSFPRFYNILMFQLFARANTARCAGEWKENTAKNYRTQL